MKKFVVVVSMLLTLVLQSSAYITITWDSSGVFDDAANSGSGLTDGSVIQLLWSSDAVMDLVGSDGSATGNDVILMSGVTTTAGPFGGWISGHAADDFYFADTGGLAADDGELLLGNVYLRVFDAFAGAIAGGTDYWQGGMIGGSLTASTGSPDSYNITDPTNGAIVPLDMVVPVPEPATFALFGLGAVVLGLRKRRRK